MTDTFPSWRYGPNGEAMICETADDVPKGWKDRPQAVEQVAEPTREELAAEVAKMDPDGDGKVGGRRKKPRSRNS
jgi:hypothetical protein